MITGISPCNVLVQTRCYFNPKSRIKENYCKYLYISIINIYIFYYGDLCK